jgi:hypothetical protein
LQKEGDKKWGADFVRETHVTSIFSFDKFCFKKFQNRYFSLCTDSYCARNAVQENKYIVKARRKNFTLKFFRHYGLHLNFCNYMKRIQNVADGQCKKNYHTFDFQLSSSSSSTKK